MNKVCTKCGVEKPVEEFYKHSKKRGLRGDCKKCTLLMQAQGYARNPDTKRANAKRWQDGNADKHEAIQKEWRSNNRDYIRAGHLRRNYGITVAEYEKFLADQKGVCAICQKTCRTGKRLAVDHCHLTKQIRGLLCQDCNLILGKFKDSASRFRRAAAYLEQISPPIPVGNP